MIKANLFNMINFTEGITKKKITLADISKQTGIHRNKITALHKKPETNMTLMDLTYLVSYFMSKLEKHIPDNTRQVVFNKLMEL